MEHLGFLIIKKEFLNQHKYMYQNICDSRKQNEKENKNFKKKNRKKRKKVKKIEIRTLEKKDLIQVVALEQKIFSVPWSLKSFEDTLKRKENIYIVAENNNQVIAYCGLWGIPPDGDICNVAVAKEYRNQKVGQALIKELLKRGQDAGLHTFTLEVRKSNQPAIHLYQKFGFKSVGIRKDFYELPKEDGIIMLCHICEAV